MTQVVPLRYDTALKKAFSQPEIFCQFAEDVLGIKFHTDEVHRGYKFLEPIGQVDIEYDLFAEDPESRIVVEIQHVKEHHFYDRFLYYHLINLVEQVKNSKAYQFNRTVYTIIFSCKNFTQYGTCSSVSPMQNNCTIITTFLE